MKQHKFRNHAAYVKAQRNITCRKLNRSGGGRVFTSQRVVDAVHKLWDGKPFKFGLCHGVRKGIELDMFEETFGGKWVGTEIVKELCDGKRVIHRDMADPIPSWYNACDVIYTNSWDHARQPADVASTWLQCLALGGRLCIEWTPWHEKIGVKGNKADCFAASADEYREILNSVGVVVDVLKIRDRATRDRRKFTRQIFVVQNG